VLDERGVVDKAGKPRYLLNNRSRVSRQLEHWLTKIQALTPETAIQEDARPLVGDFADYVRALQRIALGQDGEATPRDKLAAVKELLKLESRGTSGYIDGPSPDDPELRRRWAVTRRAEYLGYVEAAEKRPPKVA
jgi:hypothetical protein